MIEDFERCYAAVQSHDPRFDGWFYVGVSSTGIYCRPSCPAMTPRRRNVRFFATAAAAQVRGFRACKRCRPDVTPGSPEWDLRADLVGRAMRLIADGVVDREGVPGLASRLGYSVRHVHRQLVAEVGASPLALARAERARTARVLIETTDLPFARVAFAAGFSSVRQFNATIREVFAATPRDLRRRSGAELGGPGDALTLRLPLRQPADLDGVFAHLAGRAVAGLEELDRDGRYRRSLRLPYGQAIVELVAAQDCVRATLRLEDLRDLATAVRRCRGLLDLDADPVAIDAHLARDPVLAPLVAARAGIRVPGSVDGAETVIRAVLGQQVTVAAARTLTARLVEHCGTPLRRPWGGVTRLFPTPEQLADADARDLGLPTSRQRALRAAARAMRDGQVPLHPGARREEARKALVALPGIGPWTVEYVALRAFPDPDAFPSTDLGLRRAAEHAGLFGSSLPDGAALAERAEAWRPWRSYAAQHLWASARTRADRAA